MKRLSLVLSFLLFSGYAQAFMIFGEAVPIGKGYARAFVDVDKYGAPHSVGVAFPKETLQGLPEHSDAEYILRLPSILNIPPFNHLVMNWNPHGHEPSGVYTLPHFDFHFYFTSEDTQKAITCMGEDRTPCLMLPSPEHIPAFYVPTPEGVPRMGWHWVDPRSPEFQGKLFTTTFIYGFYKGQMTFVEPMITRDYLLKREKFEQEIPLPKEFPMDGYYPRAYSISFDANRNLYLVKVKNFLTAK